MLQNKLYKTKRTLFFLIGRRLIILPREWVHEWVCEMCEWDKPWDNINDNRINRGITSEICEWVYHASGY